MIPCLLRASGDWGGGRGVLLLDCRDLTSYSPFDGMWSFCHSERFVISSPIPVWKSDFCSLGRTASFTFLLPEKDWPSHFFPHHFYPCIQILDSPTSYILSWASLFQEATFVLGWAVTHRTDSSLWVELRLSGRGLEKPGSVQGLCVLHHSQKLGHSRGWSSLHKHLSAGSNSQASSHFLYPSFPLLS